MSAPVKAGHHSTWPEHIRARYGVSDRPRWVLPVLVVVGIGAAVAATAMVAQLASPPIAAGITNYVTLADDHMLIEFQVQRRDPTPATCVLRARARDSFDVGYAVVELPTAEGRTSHSFDMRTAYRPFVGELLGCSIDRPPDVSGSQFRPGVVPPEQPWTAPSR